MLIKIAWRHYHQIGSKAEKCDSDIVKLGQIIDFDQIYSKFPKLLHLSGRCPIRWPLCRLPNSIGECHSAIVNTHLYF